MKIEQMNHWLVLQDKLLNRVGIINQIHGCAYDWNCGNPCTVTYARGCYVCHYCGVDFCQWFAYDLLSLETSLDKVDSLANALWLVRRAGYLRVKET